VRKVRFFRGVKALRRIGWGRSRRRILVAGRQRPRAARGRHPRGRLGTRQADATVVAARCAARVALSASTRLAYAGWSIRRANATERRPRWDARCGGRVHGPTTFAVTLPRSAASSNRPGQTLLLHQGAYGLPLDSRKSANEEQQPRPATSRDCSPNATVEAASQRDRRARPSSERSRRGSEEG
jgi:hypothetical protein